MLEVRDLPRRYGEVQVGAGVSARRRHREIRAFARPQRHGHTTADPPPSWSLSRRDQFRSIRLGGEASSDCGPTTRPRADSLVPPGRRLFVSLTVTEHLTMSGKRARQNRLAIERRLLRCFPGSPNAAASRRSNFAGASAQCSRLSRAPDDRSASDPDDEPSLSLATGDVCTARGDRARSQARRPVDPAGRTRPSTARSPSPTVSYVLDTGHIVLRRAKAMAQQTDLIVPAARLHEPGWLAEPERRVTRGRPLPFLAPAGSLHSLRGRRPELVAEGATRCARIRVWSA